MSMEIDKICRTCLALSGPLLSIYDGGTYGDTIADMVRGFTKVKPNPTDNMPQKVCLACISEINRCFSFKMKCENSNRTLRQLLPAANPEEDEIAVPRNKKVLKSISIQTTPERDIVQRKAVHVQTSPIVERWTESILNDDSIQETQQENCTTTPLETPLESTKETPNVEETTTRARKRHAKKAAPTENAKETYKKKITESYNIDCDESGYQFILKLDANQQPDVISVKDINDENVVVNRTICAAIHNTEAYEIADESFDCEEYEIEAVVEDEDQTVQSDDVVIVKRDNDGGDKSTQKNFVIVESIKELRPRNNTQRKSISIRKEYGCTECVMAFCSLKVLRRHMSKIHGMNIDEIELNDMKYRVMGENEANETGNDTDALAFEDIDLQETATHSRAESKKNSTLKYACSKCNSTFSSQRSLNYHTKKNICNAMSYECDQCERVFKSAENLKSHKTTHNNAAIVCQDCDKVFMTTEELSSHQISVHKRSARNQCNICKKVFTMLSTLRDHLRTHSGEKPFVCSICGKAFSQNANLKQHLQRHDKDKKFKCDECPNSYVTKAELYSHKRSHNGEHPYKCEDCSAAFTTSSSLVKHRRRHTGERPYACDICPMRFAVLNVLKNHRRLHTGEKPYKCPHCDKRFTQRGDCMIHISKHAENSDYVCSCGKSFTHAALLRQHSRRSHPELYSSQEMNAKILNGVNYVSDGELDDETHIKDEDDLIEMSLEKICNQSTN